MPKAVKKKLSVDKKIDDLTKKFDEFKKSALKYEKDKEKQITKKYGEYKKAAVKYEKDTEKKIAEHPMQSMAMAFGAGLVAGALAISVMRGRR